MAQKEIGVLMGGRSAEHEISLLSGRAILNALSELGVMNVRPVVISKDNRWLVDGKEVAMERALMGLRAALLAFHGEWGEDGRAQSLLEWFSIPYCGSGPSSSAIAMNKSQSHVFLKNAGVSVPYGKVYEGRLKDKNYLNELIKRVLKNHEFPLIIKPESGGSSVGVGIARDAFKLQDAILEALKYDNRVIAEEYLDGREFSCGVLEELSGELTALPVAEILIPPLHEFFDFNAKYSGETQEIVPADISVSLTRKIQEAAIRSYEVLGCRHYCRADMIVKNNEPIVLEVNTLPGLTPESIFPKQARAHGLEFPELIERLLNLALREKYL